MRPIVLVASLLTCLGIVLAGCAPAATPTLPASAPAAAFTAAPTTAIAPTLPPVSAAASPTAILPPPTVPAAPSAVATAAGSAWKADGIISEGEYSQQTDIGPVRIWWRNDSQFLYLAMQASTTGWVAVGLDPVARMQGANFVLGAVVNGQVQVQDAYGTAQTGANHPADTQLGGTNDILEFGGVEQEGVTRIEVKIPLNSGDQYDKMLVPGQTYTVIVAHGRSDDMNSPHAFRGTGQITLDK
jgi:hypothetical protein